MSFFPPPNTQKTNPLPTPSQSPTSSPAPSQPAPSSAWPSPPPQQHLVLSFPAATTSGPHSLTDKLLLNASDFSLLAIGATTIGFVAKMWGKELIEWQDKSWFLRNTPVVAQMDDWTYAGMLGGALAAVVAGKVSSKSLGWRGLVGAVGIGSIWGTAVFFAWKSITGWEDF
ncbi:hypothetical protein PT974_06907 [Cladobotryum mycophilum]|uniref:Uncharacterized protein n=1 Tax=Cladobotryum mycophilum TaxID=491253 RepID=A0ABR0SMS3_9HYPO